MSRDAVVGHADSHPHGTLASRALTYHLHYPHLIGVGNGEALTTTIVSVLLHERSHHVDSLASGLRALQRDVDKATVVDDTLGVDQFLTSTESGLGDSELMLVDITHHIIGLRSLGNASQELARIPVIHLAHGTLGMYASGIVAKVTKHAVRVGRIAHDNRPISRCGLTYDKVRTRHTARDGGKQCHYCQE